MQLQAMRIQAKALFSQEICLQGGCDGNSLQLPFVGFRAKGVLGETHLQA